MSYFIVGMLVFALIALGLGALILYVVRSQGRREFKISRRAFTYSLVIPVALGLVFLGFFAFYEWHETPEFCGQLCHSMNGHYDTYANPENNKMIINHSQEGITCTGCHIGPGWVGQIEGFFAFPWELISETFNLYDPDDLGGQMHEEQCMKCHDGSHGPIPGDVVTVTGDLVNPHIGIDTCFNCHPTHTAGFGVSLQTCVICHGQALEDWNTSMERHGIRTGGEWLDCHDRYHPDDARVPWEEVEDILDNDFCGDCHPRAFVAWNNSATEASNELYGECVDCHIEHQSVDAFHIVDEPLQNCSQCHPTHLDYEAGSIHDRSDVDYLGITGVRNILCAECHWEETEDLDDNPQHRGLDCVFCHSSHQINLRVEFENCWICHDEESLPDHTKHDEDLTGCSCHGSGWYH